MADTAATAHIWFLLNSQHSGGDVEAKMEELRGAGPSVSAEIPVSLSERQDLWW